MSTPLHVSYRRHSEQAVRWLDRARMWKGRGFQEPCAYAADKAVWCCEDILKVWPQQGPVEKRRRLEDIVRQAKRIKALPTDRATFERTMENFWNGHEMHRNGQQQENESDSLRFGGPNIKPGGVLWPEKAPKTDEPDQDESAPLGRFDPADAARHRQDVAARMRERAAREVQYWAKLEGKANQERLKISRESGRNSIDGAKIAASEGEDGAVQAGEVEKVQEAGA